METFQILFTSHYRDSNGRDMEDSVITTSDFCLHSLSGWAGRFTKLIRASPCKEILCRDGGWDEVETSSPEEMEWLLGELRRTLLITRPR